MTSSSLLPEIVAAVVFGIAVVHTFSTKFFAHLAHVQPRHAGLWHLLAEVEVVFGFWAFILMAALFLLTGREETERYIEARNFTEPMFVFVIMVIAASRPIVNSVIAIVHRIASYIPVRREVAVYFLSLSVVPMLGSFVTEPAAMTLAALMMKDCYFSQNLSTRLKYASLGLMFVNVSIGGTLTSFAAPPVLMVAAKWQWDSMYMLTHFGWKAAFAVFTSAFIVTCVFRKELIGKGCFAQGCADLKVPKSVAGIHLLFLIGVVLFAHHPQIFMGLFLFFLGYSEAYKQYQDRLILREGLLVAFFLGGLVVLGGLQQWWLQSALTGVEPQLLYYFATALTAVTDNAALTYLASLVDGVSNDYQYAVLAGAVTGGGLTIIANAPNPAGVAILKSSFTDETVSPLALFLGALPPTLVAVFAFQVL